MRASSCIACSFCSLIAFSCSVTCKLTVRIPGVRGQNEVSHQASRSPQLGRWGFGRLRTDLIDKELGSLQLGGVSLTGDIHHVLVHLPDFRVPSQSILLSRVPLACEQSLQLIDSSLRAYRGDFRSGLGVVGCLGGLFCPRKIPELRKEAFWGGVRFGRSARSFGGC